MLPFNQYTAEHQYGEIEFPWTILTQATSKDTNQILDRRFSFLKFQPFSKEEIIREPLYDDDQKVSDFYYLNERPVDNLNYYSRYTWTINNSKNAKGEFIDNEWVFNKYKGWEKTTFNYTHIGIYLPLNLGYIKWGFKDDIVVNPRMSKTNVSNPIDLNLDLDFSIKTSTVTINPTYLPPLINIINNPRFLNPLAEQTPYPIKRKIVGNKVEYLLPLGDLAYSLEVKDLEGDVECYWSDFEGELEIPLTKGIHFVKNTHLKIIIPNAKTLKPTSFEDRDTYRNSKLNAGTNEVYKSPGFIDIILYGYKIFQTVNLANPRFIETVYEVYEDYVEIDLTDPWPNYPKLPLNLKNYLT